jgi:uncharacterized protein YegJ (DUF2314 family)
MTNSVFRTGLTRVLTFLSSLTSLATPGPALATVTEANDPAMILAVAEARRTLPIFWTQLDDQGQHTSDFRVKLGLTTPNGAVEHLWAEVTGRTDDKVSGVLLSDAFDLPLVEGAVVTESITKISDWSYFKDGRLYGGYTMRAILDRLSSRDRAEYTAILSPTPLEPDAC